MDVKIETSKNKTQNKVNTEKFRNLVIRIPKDQFPDKLTIVVKGFRITPSENKAVNEIDPRVRQLASDVANEPDKKLFQLEYISESEFTNSQTINNVDYKVYNKKFPMAVITQVHGWADRSDLDDNTPIDVVMQAITESGQKSTTSYQSINMNDVWAYNFQMAKQPLTPDTIFAYWFNGTKVGNINTLILSVISYFIETVAKLPLAIEATPKAIISKFLGPAAAEVQAVLAEVATFLAEQQPTVDLIISVTDAIKEIIANPEEALVKYGSLIFSIMIEKGGREIFGDLVYDFFGGYPVSSNPIEGLQAAIDSATSIKTEF